MEKRVKKGLEKIEKRYGAKKVLIVTHGSPARVMRGMAKGCLGDNLKFWNWGLGNGEVIELTF